MNTLTFTATVQNIDTFDIVQLPHAISAQLPSRGQVMTHGEINGHSFTLPLEPDGRGGHWLALSGELQQKLSTGNQVNVTLSPTKEWPEPSVPRDVLTALQADEEARSVWKAITPMARWEWLRWINATSNPSTRQRRIEVSCSKLRNGNRRPCCFNRNMCCVPQVSKNGVLLDAN